MKKIIIAAIIAMSTFSLTSCAGSKPSKSEVRDGVFNLLNDEAPSGTNKDQVNDLADCVIDKIYDDLSTVGAKTLAEGDKKGDGTDKDIELLNNAGEDCAKELDL